MAEPTAPPAPKQPAYVDTSIPDWMTVIKGDLDIPNRPPAQPLTDPPEPKPDKPDAAPDPIPTVPAGNPTGTPPVKEPEKQVVKEPESVEDKWPRTAVEWDKRKKDQQARLDAATKERDEIKAERDRVKTEIETLRKQGPSPELDKLKAERDQLSDQLRLVSVENHPKFKSYFENKTNAQLEMAKRIAGSEKGERIVQLLKAPEGPLRDQELENALADLNTVQQSRIASVLNNLADIDAEKQGEIAKARDSYQKIQSDQSETEKQAQARTQQSFNDIISSYTDKDKGSPAFQKRDGDEAWNAGVDQRLGMAKELLFGNPGQEAVMKAAMAAASVPAILEHAKAITAENARLQAQIKELTAAQPKVTEAPKAAGSSAPKQPTRNDPTADPMQAAANWMKQIHAPVE